MKLLIALMLNLLIILTAEAKPMVVVNVHNHSDKGIVYYIAYKDKTRQLWQELVQVEPHSAKQLIHQAVSEQLPEIIKIHHWFAYQERPFKAHNCDPYLVEYSYQSKAITVFIDDKGCQLQSNF